MSRKERAAQLRAAGERQHQKFLARQVGETHQVLIERDNIGRTEQFAPIIIDGTEPGQILQASVTGIGKHGLVGAPAKQVA